MRRVVAKFALVLAVLGYGAGMLSAGRQPESIETARHGLSGEIVVFEVANCIYCPVFRRDVLSAYQHSEVAARLPIRFLDVNDAAVNRLGLDGPIRMVPTVVVLHRNREVGRIDGYTGPQHFMAFVNNHLPTND